MEWIIIGSWYNVCIWHICGNAMLPRSINCKFNSIFEIFLCDSFLMVPRSYGAHPISKMFVNWFFNILCAWVFFFFSLISILRNQPSSVTIASNCSCIHINDWTFSVTIVTLYHAFIAWPKILISWNHCHTVTPNSRRIHLISGHSIRLHH